MMWWLMGRIDHDQPLPLGLSWLVHAPVTPSEVGLGSIAGRKLVDQSSKS